MFAICECCDMKKELKPTTFAKAVGISVSYASEILKGTRTPSRKLALDIFEKLGVRFPPIEHLSDRDIRALARIERVAA